MNDINRCFMSKTLNAFSQNSKTRSYAVLPRSPSIELEEQSLVSLLAVSVCLHLRNINKPRIRIRRLGNFNIRRMSNTVKLFEIRQHSNTNSNFVTSLKYTDQQQIQ